MAYTKTAWVDRLVQFPNRYAKTGETTAEVTLIRSAGTVTTVGTPLNATNLNKLETQYERALEDVIGAKIYAYNNLGGF